MRLALENILKPKEPVSRQVMIVKKLGGDKYQTVDVYGRYYNASSATDWKPNTYVMIQGGEILREVGKVEQPTRYKG